MVMHGPTLGDTQHAQHYDNGVQSKRAGLSGLPRMTLILHARVSFCSAESQPSTSSPRLPESTAHGPFVGAAASTSNTAMKIQHPARTSSASSVPKYPPGKRAPPRRSILAPAGARFRQPPWSRPLSAAPPPPPTKTTSHNPPQSTPSLKSLPEPSMRLRRGLTSGRTQPVSDLVESPQPPPTRRPRPSVTRLPLFAAPHSYHSQRKTERWNPLFDPRLKLTSNSPASWPQSASCCQPHPWFRHP